MIDTTTENEYIKKYEDIKEKIVEECTIEEISISLFVKMRNKEKEEFKNKVCC